MDLYASFVREALERSAATAGPPSWQFPGMHVEPGVGYQVIISETHLQLMWRDAYQFWLEANRGPLTSLLGLLGKAQAANAERRPDTPAVFVRLEFQ